MPVDEFSSTDRAVSVGEWFENRRCIGGDGARLQAEGREGRRFREGLFRQPGLYSVYALPPPDTGSTQVLVRTIPQNRRKSLYHASHAVRVVGMPHEESEKLLNELMEHATQPQFIHTHRWRVHDLVMWDNRCTMHRGTEYDERRWKRDMHRATVSDIGNTCEA